MNTCSRCGAEVNEGEQYCAQCLEKQTQQIPKQVPKQYPKQYPKQEPASVPSETAKAPKTEQKKKNAKNQVPKCPKCKSHKVFTLDSSAPGRAANENLMVCAECEHTFPHPLHLKRRCAAKKINACFYCIATLLTLAGIVLLLVQGMLFDNIAVTVLGGVALLCSVVPLCMAVSGMSKLNRKLAELFRESE